MGWELLRAYDHFYSVLGVIRLLQSDLHFSLRLLHGPVFAPPNTLSLIQQHTHGAAPPIVSLPFYIFSSCIYPSHGVLRSQPVCLRLLPWSSSGFFYTSALCGRDFLYCIGVHSAGSCCSTTVLSALIPPCRIPSRRLFLHWKEKRIGRYHLRPLCVDIS